MSDLRRIFPEHRKYPRSVVNLPASLKISTSTETLPFKVDEAVICEVSVTGVSLGLTMETAFMSVDLSKVFRRRRSCHVFCKVPGSNRTSCLFGQIIWAQPRQTSGGIQMRFGISLEDCDEDELVDLLVFLRTGSHYSEGHEEVFPTGEYKRTDDTEGRMSKQPSRSERRRHVRYPVALDGTIRISLREDSRVALKAKVTMEDVSLGGARVHMHVLKAEHAPLLTPGRHKCLLVCRLPLDEALSVLAGEIVWTDLRKGIPRSDAYLGVKLADMEPREIERLAQFISRITTWSERDSGKTGKQKV